MMGANIRAMIGVAEHDVLQQIKSGSLLSNTIAGVVFALVLGFILGLGARPSHLPIAVYNPDTQLVFKSNNQFNFFSVNSPKAAKDSISQGKAVGAVVIEGQPVTVQVIVDDTSGPAIVDVVQTGLLMMISGNHGSNNIAVGSQGLTVQHLYSLNTQSDWYNLELLLPMLMPVTSFMFAIVILGENLVRERENHTLFELAMAPVRSFWITLGKLLGGAITLFIVTFILVLATALIERFAFGIVPNGVFGIDILASLLMALGFLGSAYILSSILPSVDVYRGLVSLVLMLPLLFLCGVFLPVVSLPSWLQAIAAYTPLTWATQVTKDIWFRQATFITVGSDFKLLFAFIGVTLVLGPLSLRRILAKSLE